MKMKIKIMGKWMKGGWSCPPELDHTNWFLRRDFSRFNFLFVGFTRREE